MRMRANLASVLTAILLSVSLATSACETRCELKGTAPSCHSALGEAASQSRMASMPGMAQTAEESAANIHTAFAPVSQVCQHPVCMQQPALSSDITTAVLTHLERSCAAVAYVLAWRSDPPEDQQVAGATQARSFSPVALRTPLRI